MEKYKVILVDDEPDAVESLQFLIEAGFEELDIVGTANSSMEAVDLIAEHKPDLVFLDIEMPMANGFDLLNNLDQRNFHIIFVTAYNEYAIKAIKFSALDYLLKPVDMDDLADAIERFKIFYELGTPAERIQQLLESFENKTIKKITLQTAESIEYVHIDKIVRLESNGNYVTFHTTSHEPIMVSRTLKEFEELLKDDPFFFRAHQSHIININFIERFVKTDGGYIEMEDGTQVPLARRKKQEFMDMMEN